MRAKAGKTEQTPMLIEAEGEARRKPSSKWRELIKKIWEVDPLECPNCGGEMKIIALIDEREVIEKILRHLGLWDGYEEARGPPEEEKGYVYEPYEGDPFPDYENFGDIPAVG